MGVPSDAEEDQKKLILTSISSILAGGIARLFCHPIDTIKAKLQVNFSYITIKTYTSDRLKLHV